MSHLASCALRVAAINSGMAGGRRGLALYILNDIHFELLLNVNQFSPVYKVFKDL